MDLTNIKDIKTSEGPVLKEGDLVEFYYRLATSPENFHNGKFVETTYDPDEPIQLIYSEKTLLKGLYEGMKGMRAGGSVRIIDIPARLAYGQRAWQNIEPNTNLYIEVVIGRILYHATI